MVYVNEASSGLEWRIKVPNGSSETLAAKETSFAKEALVRAKGIASGVLSKVSSFFEKAWNLAVDDPRKVIHCLKVGLALSVVSLFYFMRPLYEGVGGNAMWAIMTVVVVFEQTVGATICKCLNRILGTLLAGFLAIGVHWIACHSEKKHQPMIIGASVFVLASLATFSRFIPTVKSRFDYGAMIFILTFSFVAVSGYRVDTLFELAHQRIATIAIGTSLCILIIMLVCPIWAGQELHTLIIRNMEKLANSLDGCVDEYFNESEEKTKTEDEDAHKRKLLGYKCVLSTKAAEEIMTNFARWEPAHGRFNFRHSWRQYLKIGASIRSCACCLDALVGCLDSDSKVPESTKEKLSSTCITISSNSSTVIREIVKTMKTMKKSSSADLLISEMNESVQELQKELRCLSCVLPDPEAAQTAKDNENKKTAKKSAIPLMEIIPMVTFASMLMEITVRIVSLTEVVSELADLAEFEVEEIDKPVQHNCNKVQNN